MTRYRAVLFIATLSILAGSCGIAGEQIKPTVTHVVAPTSSPITSATATLAPTVTNTPVPTQTPLPTDASTPLPFEFGYDLWLAVVDGTTLVSGELFDRRLQRVAELPDSGWQYPPIWSPDGRQLAFINSADPSDGNIVRLSIFDSISKTITIVHTYTVGSFGPVTAPLIKWSPDGHWVAYTPNDADEALWTVHVEDGKSYKIDPKPSGYLKESLAWAPDGEALYYLRFESQEKMSVWKTDPQGSHKESISVQAAQIVGLLPQQVAALAITSKLGEPLELTLVAFDGRQKPRVVFTTSAKEFFNQLILSADEKWAVLETTSAVGSSGNIAGNYWLINLGDATLTRLVTSIPETAETLLMPVGWTPDGRYLVEYIHRIDHSTGLSEYDLAFEDVVTGQITYLHKLPFDPYYIGMPYLSIGWRKGP